MQNIVFIAIEEKCVHAKTVFALFLVQKNASWTCHHESSSSSLSLSSSTENDNSERLTFGASLPAVCWRLALSDLSFVLAAPATSLGATGACGAAAAAAAGLRLAGGGWVPSCFLGSGLPFSSRPCSTRARWNASCSTGSSPLQSSAPAAASKSCVFSCVPPTCCCCPPGSDPTAVLPRTPGCCASMSSRNLGTFPTILSPPPSRANREMPPPPPPRPWRLMRVPSVANQRSASSQSFVLFFLKTLTD